MSEWNIIEEPATPMAAKRLTTQAKLYLTAQRNLDEALKTKDEESLVKNFVALGHFREALKVSTTKINKQWVRALIDAGKNPTCDCPPVELELKVGNETFHKLASPWQSVQVYPQGKLWRCSTCGIQTFNPYPDQLSKHQEEMRITLPAVLEGPDFAILPNKE